MVVNPVKRIFLQGLLLIATLSCACQKPQAILPDRALPGMDGYLEGTLIFTLDQRPTLQCHASTIVETPSGLVAAWFGGTHEKNPDVGIWSSHLINGQWSAPVEVANGIQNDSLRYPCWNPVLFRPGEGPLMLFYKVGPDPRQWWGEMITSGDEGRTWSTPTRLGEGKLGHLIGPVKNKPVQLQDGTIISPSSTESHQGKKDIWRVHFELTKDHGKSWEVIGPINDGIRYDAIQPAILTYPDGRLQVLCRTMQEVISESWSTDGGKNWSNMSATMLPNPSAGIDAVTLRDGRQLLVYNHARGSRIASGRQILNLAISVDGKNWTPVLTLEHQPGMEFSYPAVIQADDGNVHITYTYDRRSIKHVVLDPGELK